MTKKISVSTVSEQAEYLNLVQAIKKHFAFEADPIPTISALIAQANATLEPFKKRMVTSQYIPAKEILEKRLRNLEINLDKSCRFDDEEYNMLSRIWEAYREAKTHLTGEGRNQFNPDKLLTKFLKDNSATIKEFAKATKATQKNDSKSTQNEGSIVNFGKTVKNTAADPQIEKFIATLIFNHCFEVMNASNTYDFVQDIIELEKKTLPLRDNDKTCPILMTKLDGFLRCPFNLFANTAYHEAGFIHSTEIYQKSFKKFF